MSLNSIISSKDKFIANLLVNFDKQWDIMAPKLKRDLVKLFNTGEFSEQAIQIVFQANGFDDMAGVVSGKYNQMFKFSRDVSKELGYNFILTPDNRKLFQQMNDLNLETLLNTKAQIATDMKRFAIESQLENRTVAGMRSGLDRIFTDMGRRLNTEIHTGIRSYESAIDLTSMRNGGITLFRYIGPVDGKTRPVCVSTSSDKRQETGWTMEEVENSETPFIQRGG